MGGDRIAMSQRERDRLKVMGLVLTRERTQAEAARLLGLSVRQVRRVERRWEVEGDGGVVHRLRGRPSNRRKDPTVRAAVLGAYRVAYQDFGPTFAAEKLAERDLIVSAETLRRWLLAEGLWERHRRREVHRRRRERRACFGELVQADGSLHDWLEGRGETMTLLVMIDDATSRALARFCPAETTEGYMDLLGRYLRKWGRMVALYTDRDSIFWGETKTGERVQTQFTRALSALQIEWIPAHSPQAKGRVERFNGTAQDRLVKELRLAQDRTIPEANAVLERRFLPWFNRRCTVKAASPNDAHRALGPSFDLASILSLHQTRTVASDYTIRLDGRVYQILPPAYPGLRGGKVSVERRLDGTLHLRFDTHDLRYDVLGADKDAGALPPHPRSLSPLRIPAGTHTTEGGAALATPPPAVHPARRRSGRTPAEPYPSTGARQATPAVSRRPDPNHPWRKYPCLGPRRQEDISIVAK